MPRGRYAVLGDGGTRVATETFRCAPGPLGWRYASETDGGSVDLVTDAAWRLVRVRAVAGEHHLLLEAREGSLAGSLDGDALEVTWAADDHLELATPATYAITTVRLDDDAGIAVVRLDPSTLRPSRTTRRYERVGGGDVETPVGTFRAARWRLTTPGTEHTEDLWVAGDVIVAWPQRYVLEEYEAGASGPVPLG